MFYIQETLWQSIDGSVRSFSAMTNEHLANVVMHFQHYGSGGRVLSHALKEINIRGLSEEFLKGAPYPYQNPRTGKWYIWSFEVDDNIPVSGKVDVTQNNG